MAHRNIPIFIPHMGCPNQCVFCNQRSISGHCSFREEAVTEEIEAALSTIPDGSETEIAFFGGSFTGIDRGLMIRLLELAEGYVRVGRVRGIRLSTRPDYISEEILSILSQFSVLIIELGLQSMDSKVLQRSGRGHTAEESERACRAVTAAGFSLVGQMMIGLPGSTPEKEIMTAERICALGASAARIYPTVVFHGTPLCEMAKAGVYTPLSLEEAVRRSVDALRVFRAHGVDCIRIGLCAGEALTSPEAVFAGPNHPALGELVQSALYYDSIKEALLAKGLLGTEAVLLVPAREISRAVGQHRSNLARLAAETGTCIRRVIGHDSSAVAAIPWQTYRNQQQEETRRCI